MLKLLRSQAGEQGDTPVQKVDCCKQAVICIVASEHCLRSGRSLPHLFRSLAHCCTCEGRLKAPVQCLRSAVMQQSCAEMLIYVSIPSGRTCPDRWYERSLLPYRCAVRTVCSEKGRSLIRPVLFCTCGALLCSDHALKQAAVMFVPLQLKLRLAMLSQSVTSFKQLRSLLSRSTCTRRQLDLTGGAFRQA